MLLAEKAAELEPSWEQACAAAAEIVTLQDLETTVAERAIAVRAESLKDVRAKLAIWRALAPGAEDGDMGTRAQPTDPVGRGGPGAAGPGAAPLTSARRARRRSLPVQADRC